MTLLRGYQDDEYLPDYSTLVVRDAGWRPGLDAEPDDETRAEHATHAQPGGTIARAGDGWLQASASSEYHVVRLEAHDCAPPDDSDAWTDVFETPFRSFTGRVGLNHLVSTDRGVDLDLGDPGCYRVRLARRRNEDQEGDVFRLQFWPAAVELPRCLARGSALPADTAPATPAQDRRRFGYLASDLEALVWWSPVLPATLTVANLAERLLVSAGQVRAALRHAVAADLLTVTGDLADAAAPVVLDLTPVKTLAEQGIHVTYEPMPAPGPPWNRPLRPAADTLIAAAGDSAGTAGWVAASGAPEPPYRPPVGAPPRTGFVSDRGDVVAWRAGAPVVVTRIAGKLPERAAQTGYGILLLGYGGATLVRDDGSTEAFGSDLSPGAAVSEDGRYVAVQEFRVGRRSWQRLHLVDLADGSYRTMPWDDHAGVGITAVHAGVVYFFGGYGSPTSMRWVPGSDPEPLGYQLEQVEPATGAHLVRDGQSLLVRHRDGTEQRLPPDVRGALSPGGRYLYEFGHVPPAVSVVDTSGPARQPQVWWLPGQAEVSGVLRWRPVWEDEHHIVVLLKHPDRDFGGHGVRLDVRSGQFQAVPLPPEAGGRPMLVRPMATPAPGSLPPGRPWNRRLGGRGVNAPDRS